MMGIFSGALLSLRDVHWSLIPIHATGASKCCTVANPSRSAQISFAPAQRATPTCYLLPTSPNPRASRHLQTEIPVTEDGATTVLSANADA
jgi:hypothetical protein